MTVVSLLKKSRFLTINDNYSFKNPQNGGGRLDLVAKSVIDTLSEKVMLSFKFQLSIEARNEKSVKTSDFLVVCFFRQMIHVRHVIIIFFLSYEDGRESREWDGRERGREG